MFKKFSEKIVLILLFEIYPRIWSGTWNGEFSVYRIFEISFRLLTDGEHLVR